MKVKLVALKIDGHDINFEYASLDRNPVMAWQDPTRPRLKLSGEEWQIEIVNPSWLPELTRESLPMEGVAEDGNVFWSTGVLVESAYDRKKEEYSAGFALQGVKISESSKG